MYNVDVKLIKMCTTHYWQKRDGASEKLEFKGKTYFNKFEKISKPLTLQVMSDHQDGKITVAHSLILPGQKVENIVFDYNGRDPERFWHRAQLLFREEGFINFTAYKSKTEGHLHLYIHKGHTTLSEGIHLAKTLSAKLAQRLPTQWNVFPNDQIPVDFNILTLPYELYQKERGASWSKHL
ncbi:MAG: DUF1882 domain-containing protein [Campylobacterales bacterium]|nr:DUF1882 domain-containing protein [Campylobacterales bacterium]